MESVRFIPRRDIRCTRCDRVLPMTEFPPEYVVGKKKDPLCRECKKERFAALRERRRKEREELRKQGGDKQCRGCGQFKPLSAFSESLSYKDGLHSHCRECVAKQMRVMKARWAKERKQVKPPEEKLCTRCYRVLPISHFCPNRARKDGFDTICRSCLGVRSVQYAARWREERKTGLKKKMKRCPGCSQELPVSAFWANDRTKDGLSSYCISCHKRMWEEKTVEWEQLRAEKPSVDMKKECRLCHRVLPVNQFYPNRRYKDGYSGTCIACEERRAQQYMMQWQERGKGLPEEKECIRCQRVLPADQFVFNKRKKDGLSSMCRACEQAQREQYARRWEVERQQKQMGDGFSLFPDFEKTCSMCGETKSVRLFSPHKHSKDGFASECRECRRRQQREYTRRIRNSTKTIPVEKKCSDCQRVLPASAFYKCNQRKDGLKLYCRECTLRRRKEYLSRPEVKDRLRDWEREYQKKPEVAAKRRAYMRKYYQRPEVKAKAKRYRDRHRAKPEVKKQRSEQGKAYYQLRKKAKKVSK